jgi:hypothetical protein
MDPMLGPDATAAYAASANGPIVVDWHIFAWIFTNIMGPLDGAEGQITQSLQTFVMADVAPIFILYMLAWLFVQLWHPSSPAATAMGSVGIIMRFTTMMVVAGNLGHLNDWVINPLKATPTNIANTIGAVGGGQAVQGGAQFDQIVNLMVKAGLASINHASGVVQTIEVAVIVGLCLIIDASFVGVGFLIWTLAFALFDVVLNLAPIAVFFGAFRYTRHLMSGWLGGVVSLIATIVIASIIVQMAFLVVQHIAQPLAAAPDNADVSGMAVGMIQTVIVSIILMGCLLQARQLAVGMFGGIMAGFEHFGAAASVAYSSAYNTMTGAMAAMGAAATPTGGAAAAGGGTAAAANAGRSLSGAGTGLGARP